jgi:hypothetical protein
MLSVEEIRDEMTRIAVGAEVDALRVEKLRRACRVLFHGP